MDELTRTMLDIAERIAAALEARGHRCVLIGAAAMAVYGYSRSTQDLDLGTVGVPLATLREVAEVLRQEGLSVELREPDAADPLGGLLRIEIDETGQVDVVNFGNPWTRASLAVGEAALEAPTLRLTTHRLEVVGLPSLVLLKIAAGSRFDLNDAAELLQRHPEIDRDALRARCVSLRLDRKLDRVLDLLADEDH